jgi:Tol biopolymer transport system component
MIGAGCRAGGGTMMMQWPRAGGKEAVDRRNDATSVSARWRPGPAKRTFSRRTDTHRSLSLSQPLMSCRRFVCWLVSLAIVAAPVLALAQATTKSSAVRNQRAPVGPKLTVMYNQYQSPVMSLFIANADGSNEHPLFPSPGLDYSPSYSADGKWIVVTREKNGQADIFRVHPDGSGLEQLTDDPAFDDQGTLSPDGKTLAFVSTRGGGTANVWLMDMASRKARNLTASKSGNFRPAWSPDGKWIAFSSDRDSRPAAFPGSWEQMQSTGIYIVAPDGSGLRRLTRKGGVAGSPAWSPDGKRVVFYETDEVGAYMAKSGNARTEIAAVDIASGAYTPITASNETKLSPAALPGRRFSFIKRGADSTAGLRIYTMGARTTTTVVRGAVRNPSWSPDGAHVAFQRIQRLGTTQHLVPTFSRDPAFENVLNEPFPELSPDGTKLLFSQYIDTRSPTTGLTQSNTGNTSVELVNADGTGERTIFHQEGFSAFDAVWSPKGDEIALSVGRYFRRPGPPPGQIALMKPDGSDFRVIVDDSMNNGFASWSPDGSTLVFKRGHQLVTMSLADRKIVPLTDGTHYDNFPQWSPKGDAILFTSDRADGDFELYTIRPDGTGLRRLTNVYGNDAHASWCAGGNWILFSSGRMGFKDEMALYDAVPQPYGEIFAMRADGTDVHQLTDNKWEDSSASCRH